MHQSRREAVAVAVVVALLLAVLAGCDAQSVVPTPTVTSTVVSPRLVGTMTIPTPASETPLPPVATPCAAQNGRSTPTSLPLHSPGR